MYWKIVTNDLNFLLSLSVSVMKERLSWNWNMKARKKKTPSLVLLVNLVIEETWADRGVTLDTSASEAFYIGQVALATQLIKPNYLVQTGLQHHGKHQLKTWTNTFRKWLYVFRCVYCFLRYLV